MSANAKFDFRVFFALILSVMITSLVVIVFSDGNPDKVYHKVATGVMFSKRG